MNTDQINILDDVINDYKSSFNELKQPIDTYHNSNIIALTYYDPSVSGSLNPNYLLYLMLDSAIFNINNKGDKDFKQIPRIEDIGKEYKKIITNFYISEAICLVLFLLFYYIIKMIHMKNLIQKISKIKKNDVVLIVIISAIVFSFVNSGAVISPNLVSYHNFVEAISHSMRSTHS
ncbi:hypothetical protein AB4Z22_42210, partial [Paenibacillus sp. TAF58]